MIQLEMLESDELSISIDIIVVSDYHTESIDVDSNVQSIIDDIVDIIKSFGYYTVDAEKSPRSTSLYFKFCNDEEFDMQEVTLVVGLRVADHGLNPWNRDTSKQDAKNRQLHKLQQFAKDNKWFNKNLKDEEEIPVEQIYVQYENEFYTTLDDVYNKIRRKLQSFKSRHE